MYKYFIDLHSPRFQKLDALSNRILPFQISRLGARFLMLVIGTVFLAMLLSSALILSLKQQQLIDDSQVSVQHVSDVIWASLDHAMRSNDKPMLDQMFSTIAREAGANILLLKPDGQVWLSSTPGESEKPVRLTDPLCRACHASPNVFAIGVAVPKTQISGDVLLNVTVIPNQPTCYGCHDSARRSLGLLLFETPFVDVQQELISSFWQIAIVAVILFALLAGLLTFAFNAWIIQPVANLAMSVKEFGAGNLNSPLPANRTSDELGNLATAFETMREQLKTALVEKEQRNQELQMINDIARITSAQLEPQQILDLTIKAVVKSLKVEAGAIRVLDREGGRLTLHACQGIPECQPKTCNLRAINIALGESQSADNAAKSALVSTEAVTFGIEADAQGHSYVGIPLEAKGVLVGAVTLITYPGQTVTDEGKRTLKAMGQQIGLAVLNAIRFQRARYDATLEERDRLAREMHDSLAQALGYLKMKASMTDELLSGGQIDEAQVNLREVKEIAKETYFDVRETIFSLRNTSAKGMQFLPGLTEYLDKYRLHYGLQVHLAPDENCYPAFSPETSIQLTRIIQEALTNVRKHAESTEATIRIARNEHHWRITVEDRGAGFDSRETKSEGWRFLGLHIMQERAEGIGAELDVDSQPGFGTRVTIRVPIEAEA